MHSDKPSVVLVHGFLSSYTYWDELKKALSPDFNVYAYDNPGYGALTAKVGPDSITEFAQNVIRNLDADGVEDFYLLGHSMGGMIVQEIALMVPDRVKRLVLYGTGPDGSLPGRFEPLEVSMAKATEEGLGETKRYTVASWFVAGIEHPSFAPVMEMATPVSLQTFKNGLKAMAGWSAVNRLSQVKAKTLVLWSDGDKSYTWEVQPYALWKGIPGANLAVIPGCAHNAHLEKPDLFNRLVSDFFLA